MAIPPIKQNPIDAMINILNSFKGMNTENIKTEKPTITEMPLNNIPFPDTFIVLEIASSKLSPSLRCSRRCQRKCTE